MLIFKYKKTGSAAFIPHVDTLRQIVRTIRRAGIDVCYSQGFNPHMNIYLSPPMPLGFESLCEYCTVDTAIPADEFMRLYNLHSLKGMECLEAAEVTKNPNIAGAAAAALYEIESPALREGCDRLFGARLIASGKDGKEKDVTSGVLEIKRTDKGVSALLNFGNLANLRIDNFLEALGRVIPFEAESVIKTQLFCRQKDRIIPAADYISAFFK